MAKELHNEGLEIPERPKGMDASLLASLHDLLVTLVIGSDEYD
jgi:hypothetical protein